MKGVFFDDNGRRALKKERKVSVSRVEKVAVVGNWAGRKGKERNGAEPEEPLTTRSSSK